MSMDLDMEHFVYCIFSIQTGDLPFRCILNSINCDELPVVGEVHDKTLYMTEIYGHIFDEYFNKRFNENNEVLYSRKKFAEFIVVRCLDFCTSPSFFNFLIVFLFMMRLLKSQQRDCYLVFQILAKCLMLIYNKRYVVFFEQNGGVMGMWKYLKEIEDLSNFLLENEDSEDMLILSPQKVGDIIDAFDKYDRYYQMDEFELNYLYEFHFNLVDIVAVKDNLKMLDLPMSLDIEEETKKLEFIFNGLKINQNSNILEEEDSTIEYLMDDLYICGDENTAGIKKICSYCGEKNVLNICCFKFINKCCM
ncbi:hypothetical protein CEXT_809141 [Caerostris extrusa]|uniref:Uncharacterized protein n=1 Tax=Caerostris extrusa TaxID=172846 RepID=A0AAV4QG14_CAEEX|nr:hypothetical protein CEXT_809141 [Caerostris extrusa]